MKSYLILVLFVLALQYVQAQDKIVHVNGDELVARVLEITHDDIIYRHPDSLQGTLQRMPKKDVFMVRFANGTKEVFSHNLPDNTEQAVAAQTPAQMYLRGRQDASMYYKGNGAMWGSAAASVIFPYGLAGAAAIALIPPRAHNNIVSDPRLLSDPNFVRGYEDQARRKKSGKVLAGAGIGLATVMTIAVVVLSTVW